MRSVAVVRAFLTFACLIFLTAGAAAQGCGQANPNCIVPTAPIGTKNNQAASTAFVLNPTGAKCDGVTDDSAAINAAIAALPVPNGGRIHLPACATPYIINAAAITLPNDHQPVIIEGDGWDSPLCDPFGNAAWIVPGNVRGTVIRVTGTTDGILFAAPNYNQNYIIRDLAIVGPGSGTSKGINFGTSTATYDQITNVLVANFSSGVYLKGTGNTVFRDLAPRGNTVGVNMASNGTATIFYDILAECNATGILMSGMGTGTHIYGGLIQGNTSVGINIAPSVAALASISIDGLWMEANTIGVQVDTTNFGVSNLLISNHRDSGSNSIVFTGGNTVNFFKGINWQLSADVTLPANMVNSGLYGVSSGTITDNSNCSVLINTTLSNKLFCTYTVVQLPVSANQGAMAFVSNATACTKNAAPVGGGSTFCGVVWNGSAWVAY